MKKAFAFVLAAVMMLTLVACGNADGQKDDGKKNEHEVNLMDEYTVKDPEGVEYDQRVALYMPILESAEEYTTGARSSYTVLYGKENKGVFMTSVVIYDSEESAAAAQKSSENANAKVDGKAVITESDATFFTAMEEFFPDFQSWIDTMQQAGMTQLD